MKKKYVKVEILGCEQLRVNQAIASCSYEFTGRYQNSAERAISPVYGYGSQMEALDIRWPDPQDISNVNNFDGYWGLVGPIYDVTVVADGVTYHFYWEDFNNDEMLNPGGYSMSEQRPSPDKYASIEAGQIVYQNGGVPLVTTTQDNFQSVEQGVPGGEASWFGPRTGKPIRS